MKKQCLQQILSFKAIFVFLYFTSVSATEQYNVGPISFNGVPKDVLQYMASRFLDFKDLESLWWTNKRIQNILHPIIISIRLMEEQSHLALYLHDHRCLKAAVENITLPNSIDIFVSIDFVVIQYKEVIKYICIFNRIHLLSALWLTNKLPEDRFAYLAKYAIKYKNNNILKMIIKDSPEAIFRKMKFYNVSPLQYATNSLNIVQLLFNSFGSSKFMLPVNNFSETFLHECCSVGSKDVILYLASADPSLFSIKDRSGKTPVDVLLHLISVYNDSSMYYSKGDVYYNKRIELLNCLNSLKRIIPIKSDNCIII